MDLPTKVTQIIKDIEDIKIQGATAVAVASFEGIKIFLQEYKNLDENIEVFMMNVEKAGLALVNARPNEPLARNGLRYLLSQFKLKHPDTTDVATARDTLINLMNDFIELLTSAKEKIVDVGVEEFKGLNGILTHCHSSTVENVCKGIVAEKKEKEWFSIVATETRPRYQGRITVKNLAEAGLETLMIVDDAVTSFLAGEFEITGDWGGWEIPVDAVFIGCDEILFDGRTINKVGSYAVALAAYHTSKPLYVMGTILKLNPSTIYDIPRIEMRDPKEIWAEAPDSVRIINPAFEIVPKEFITGFVTEFGIVKPDEVEKLMSDKYGWMYQG